MENGTDDKVFSIKVVMKQEVQDEQWPEVVKDEAGSNKSNWNAAKSRTSTVDTVLFIFCLSSY